MDDLISRKVAIEEFEEMVTPHCPVCNAKMDLEE